MDFIATAPVEVSDTVKNDGWFPDIDLKSLREAMRLDGTVTPAHLIQAVTAAIAQVNMALLKWQTQQQAVGYLSLGAVPAAQVNDESTKLIFYRRAIYYFVKADLIEQYRDFDSTHSGMQHAERLTATSDDDRRNAHWALADLQNRSHVTVDLI